MWLRRREPADGSVRVTLPAGTSLLFSLCFVGLSPANGATDGGWRGEVFTRQVLGTSILYDVRSGGDHVTSVTGSQELLPLGTNVSVEIQWPRAFFFDKESEQRIEV